MVVVGASNVVGKPMAVMALQREATVTACHAKTRDLAEHTRHADVLICAAGYSNLMGKPREGVAHHQLMPRPPSFTSAGPVCHANCVSA